MSFGFPQLYGLHLRGLGFRSLLVSPRKLGFGVAYRSLFIQGFLHDALPNTSGYIAWLSVLGVRVFNRCTTSLTPKSLNPMAVGPDLRLGYRD